jgi:hypothetical protein
MTIKMEKLYMDCFRISRAAHTKLVHIPKAVINTIISEPSIEPRMSKMYAIREPNARVRVVGLPPNTNTTTRGIDRAASNMEGF